jgi:hypothetical protein
VEFTLDLLDLIRTQFLVAGSRFSVMSWIVRRWVRLAVVSWLLVAPALAQTGSSATDHSKSAKPASSPASEADIAVAKASGKVWVNLDSGVYHKGGRWYGKTKNGKFMTADDAKKAGYTAAKRD